MSKSKLSREILDKAKQITGKRARVVVDHILKHGRITTEDLKNYGYDHPPRAIKDVTDQGLPLERFRVKNSQGRKIAGYRFGDPAGIRHDRFEGRTVIAKKWKRQLVESHHGKCGICGTPMEERYLQVDHRIPYAIAGEAGIPDSKDYMPLCGSCNRAKSWSCEHCDNWHHQQDPNICRTCYWANPGEYQHIAMRQIRRLDVVWEGSEVHDYEKAALAAKREHVPLPDFVKAALRRALDPGTEPERP